MNNLSNEQLDKMLDDAAEELACTELPHTIIDVELDDSVLDSSTLEDDDCGNAIILFGTLMVMGIWLCMLF